MDVESRETLYSTIGQWRLSNHFRIEDRRQQAKVSDQSDLFIFFYIFIIFFWRDSTTAARASFGRRRPKKNSEKNENKTKTKPKPTKKKTKNAKRNLWSKRERERECLGGRRPATRVAVVRGVDFFWATAAAGRLFNGVNCISMETEAQREREREEAVVDTVWRMQTRWLSVGVPPIAGHRRFLFQKKKKIHKKKIHQKKKGARPTRSMSDAIECPSRPSFLFFFFFVSSFFFVC